MYRNAQMATVGNLAGTTLTLITSLFLATAPALAQPQPQQQPYAPQQQQQQPYAPSKGVHPGYPSLTGCGYAWGTPEDCEKAKRQIDEQRRKQIGQ